LLTKAWPQLPEFANEPTGVETTECCHRSDGHEPLGYLRGFLLVATAGAADTPPVTGTVSLPAGATAPASFRVDVEILKLEPGQVLTLARQVGRQQISTAKAFPVQFAVSYPKTVLKDPSPKSFVLRASVYELPKSGGAKLLYRTPDSELVEAFSGQVDRGACQSLAIGTLQTPLAQGMPIIHVPFSPPVHTSPGAQQNVTQD
jgi:hypothetical protein